MQITYFIPIGRIPLRDVYVRISQNNTPATATVGFIDVIGYYLTTCFGPHGSSSGEYNILIRPLTSSENYRYYNGSVLSKSLIV
jgi:hypothetical protein